MATAFCCGFECGVLVGVGAHWSAFAGSPAFSTTTVRSGLRSIRFNVSASTAIISSPNTRTTGANAVNVGRFAIRFAALPDADTILLWDSSATNWGLYFQVSDGKLYCRSGGANGATGVVVTTGTWYVIDFRDTTDATALLKTVEAKVDGIALGTASLGAFSGTGSQWRLGLITSTTADMFVDDFIASTTNADYPFGDGYVLSYIPNADGSHNVAGANDFEKTLTGTDITNATTDAWQLVDERPLPTTAVDFINGVAPPNNTDYVEVAYEDSAESTAPLAVEGIVVYHDAGGAGTNQWRVEIRDSNGGTTDNIVSLGAGNVGATITYGRQHFPSIPGTSNAWTLTAFNALRSRFVVSDASPDPYIDALMLEAEYAAAVVPYTGPLIRAITVLDACHRAAFH